MTVTRSSHSSGAPKLSRVSRAWVTSALHSYAKGRATALVLPAWERNASEGTWGVVPLVFSACLQCKSSMTQHQRNQVCDRRLNASTGEVQALSGSQGCPPCTSSPRPTWATWYPISKTLKSAQQRCFQKMRGKLRTQPGGNRSQGCPESPCAAAAL